MLRISCLLVIVWSLAFSPAAARIWYVPGDASSIQEGVDAAAAGDTVEVAAGNYNEGIENLARYFEHGKIKIADQGDLQRVVRQLLRYHRDESGRIVKKEDHGPDALLCAMLPFPFIDEFDTAISQLLSGNDRERLKVTDRLLDACIRDYEQVPDTYHGSSMGVSVGASGFYVVISTISGADRSQRIRKALFIGRVKTFDDLDDLMRRYHVLGCVISMQPEPHLVQAWRKQPHAGSVYMVHFQNDGVSKPEWPQWTGTVTVDRTFILNSAYEEIKEQRWWLPRYAGCIDGGEFYAQLKAPSRVRDLSTGELRYRWTETGALDHYRFAHAFDHLYGAFRRAGGMTVDFV